MAHVLEHYFQFHLQVIHLQGCKGGEGHLSIISQSQYRTLKSAQIGSILEVLFFLTCSEVTLIGFLKTIQCTASLHGGVVNEPSYLRLKN